MTAVLIRRRQKPGNRSWTWASKPESGLSRKGLLDFGTTRQTRRVLESGSPFCFLEGENERMLNSVPNQIGAAVTGEADLFWPSSADNGIKVGAIAFHPVQTEAPGFVKEFNPAYGQVWRRISAAEIQHRRKTTLWK